MIKCPDKGSLYIVEVTDGSRFQQHISSKENHLNRILV